MESHKNLSILQSYISKMPPLPVTVARVIEICDDVNASPADLSKIINLDPVLTGKVLKLINSAYYGMVNEITSPVRAIIMLGINTVKNLALSTAILGNLGNSKNFCALDMDKFWRHSLSVGVISRLIAKKRNINRDQIEECFIAGLLHDIGKIPLNNKFSDEYILAMDLSDRERQPVYISEKQFLEIDHTDVGKLIAEKWKLGTEIIDTVTYHHSLEAYKGSKKDILYTVALANYFANVLESDFSVDRYPEEIGHEVLHHLDIIPEYLEDIRDEVTGEIEKAQVFLKIAG